MAENKDKKILDHIKSNIDKFSTYNKRKLDNLYSSITKPALIDVFESIPLLLHLNQNELPGFVDSDKIPKGIVNYTPTSASVSYIRSRNPSIIISKESIANPFVQMFAIMGSSGTIAFNDKSDFDFWVCYDGTVHDSGSVKLFRKKCTIIEEWLADKYNVEVHFFLNEISKVRNNIFDEDEKEGLAGTSLGQLLKEEFFRSSIILNGKIPFWWAVPSGYSDKKYYALFEIVKRSILSERYIDIGNISQIEEKDFVIAGLFQILKSLGNPFKSIIKIGLLDRYLSKTENPFICNLIKKNIHSSKLDMEDVDAYLIMFNQIYDYYWEIGNDNAADIVKKSFYLKLDLKLSKHYAVKKEELSDKIKKMMEYAEKWEWSRETVMNMDDFESWDIDTVNTLMTNTKKYILNVYKNILGNIVSKKIMQGFDNERIKGITNRIYSHFAPGQYKIDNTLNFKSYPPEKLIKIESIMDKNNREIWMLSKKVITRKLSSNIIIHKENSLIGIIVWISLNGVFQKDFSRLDISSGLYQVDRNFIQDLIWDLSISFRYKKLELNSSYFLKDSFPLINYIVINPYSRYANDIEDIIHLYHNSWGETKFDMYKSEVDIPRIILNVLNAGIVGGYDFNTCIGISSGHPFRSNKEYLRIKTFLSDIYKFLVEDESEDLRKYITIFGGNFFVFIKEKKGNKKIVSLKSYKSEIQMLYSISYSKGVDCRIKFDPSITELQYLNGIVENNKDEKIQIYFEEGKRYCFFYISDERGSLITCRKDAESFFRYLLRLYLFAENVAKQVKESNPDSTLDNETNMVEVYRLERRGKTINIINKIDSDMEYRIQSQKGNVTPFGLIMQLMDNGGMGYRIQLPDGGFSSTFDKMGILDIAQELKVLMDSVTGYYYYITDINLAHLRMKIYQDYSSFSFSEKNKMELLIENCLRQIKN